MESIKCSCYQFKFDAMMTNPRKSMTFAYERHLRRELVSVISCCLLIIVAEPSSRTNSGRSAGPGSGQPSLILWHTTSLKEEKFIPNPVKK